MVNSAAAAGVSGSGAVTGTFQRARWCGNRLQTDRLPDWLVSMLDGHAWLSVSPFAASLWSRTVCEHVDYEIAWHDHRDVFNEHSRTGAPPPSVLWQVKRVLEAVDIALILDVEVELVEDRLALAVYGAGVRGRLDDVVWKKVAGMLTTCCSMLHESVTTVLPLTSLQPVNRDPEACERTLRTDVPTDRVRLVHLWGYPIHGVPAPHCTCRAHEGVA